MSDTMMAPERAQLVGGANNCDDTFARVFNEVRGELVSTLFFVLGNHDDAQDAAQDAFCKYWRARHSLPKILNMRAWIFQVGMNAAKDLRRNAWRRRSRPITAEVAQHSLLEDAAARTLEDKENVDQLRRALLELRPEEKAVFLLRQNGLLTYAQIAELRQSPIGSVKTLMRAALSKLRQMLEGK
jgi:RNA polymerase sigma-70 factor (ECF subfamily)